MQVLMWCKYERAVRDLSLQCYCISSELAGFDMQLSYAEIPLSVYILYLNVGVHATPVTALSE